MSPRPPTEPRRLTFRARNRLSLARDYQAIYGAKVRKARGPLTVFARPNEKRCVRLGLSVGRRVGGAVARGRIKRLLREAFRHLQYDLPVGYDFVVNVRAHEPLALAEYQRLLFGCCRDLEREWARRGTPDGSCT